MRPSGSGVEPFRTTSLSGSGSQHMYAAILTDKFETHAVGLVPASPNMEIHLRLACRRERSRQLSPAFRPPSRIPDTGRLRTCVDLDRSSRRPERALPSRESAAGRRRGPCQIRGCRFRPAPLKVRFARELAAGGKWIRTFSSAPGRQGFRAFSGAAKSSETVESSPNSPLEGTGFEPSVPLGEKRPFPKREHPRATSRSLPGRPQTISARTTVRAAGDQIIATRLRRRNCR